MLSSLKYTARTDSKKNEINKRILEADEKLLKWMSEGQDATATSTIEDQVIPPMVEVLDYPSRPSSKDLVRICNKIEEGLASGRAVALVPDSTQPDFEWTEESIARITCGMKLAHITVTWQCKW